MQLLRSPVSTAVTSLLALRASSSEHPLLSVLRTPESWFPAARALRRRVILHVGPTNSGKTHAALAALRTAPSGVYAAPLRLLAWETAEKLRAGGLAVRLVTGQEVEPAPGAHHVSATVEMVETTTTVDVGVLDEVQCLGDASRGWAWSRLLLGLPARELHCCGDAAAVPLVRALCANTGDSVEVRSYERLSPLTAAPAPVRRLTELRRGDAVIAFSRRELFAWKARIEKGTGLSCGVVYGALPPAVRREEARRFNGSGVGTSGSSSVGEESPLQSELPRTDVLVATDAVGMGLNLAIERVLFTSFAKFDGLSRRPLLVSEAKQIAGRAGRFGSEYAAAGGSVAACDSEDHAALRRALRQTTPEVRLAGIQPQFEHLELFAASLVDADVLASLEARTLASAAAVTASLPSLSVPSPPPPLTIQNDGPEGMHVNDDLAACLARYERRFESENSEAVAAAAARAAAAMPFSVLLDSFFATAQGAFPDAAAAAAATGGGPPQGSRRARPVPPKRMSAGGGTERSRDAAALLPPLLDSAPRSSIASSPYFMCDARDLVEVARALDDIPLSFRARYVFVVAPVDAECAPVLAALRRYARHYARRGRVRVGLPPPPLAGAEPAASAQQLQELETAHAVYSLYLYLAQRFPVEFADDRVTAEAGARRTEELIAEGLRALSAAALSAHDSERLVQRHAAVVNAPAAAAARAASRAGRSSDLLPPHLEKLLRRLEARALDALVRSPPPQRRPAVWRHYSDSSDGLAAALLDRLPPLAARGLAAATEATAIGARRLPRSEREVVALADGLDVLVAMRRTERAATRRTNRRRSALSTAADDAILRSVAAQLRRLCARAGAAAERARARLLSAASGDAAADDDDDWR